MKFHEVANLMPMMTPEELAELTADIKANGQREPITTYQGEILDGRNRYLACEAAGVEPRFHVWTGAGSPVEFVLSMNVHRRHLTAVQRAVIAEAAEPMFAAEARKRQATSTGGLKPQLVARPPEPATGRKSRDEAAKATGASGRNVSRVKAIRKAAPEIVPLMRDGKATMQEAQALTQLPAEQRKAIIASVDAGKPLASAQAAVVFALPTRFWSRESAERRIKKHVKREVDIAPPHGKRTIATFLHTIAKKIERENPEPPDLNRNVMPVGSDSVVST
jgi:ParB-like chromosome segregation protein Spo0J